MIDLEFFESTDNYGTIKATVHKTGKLGFSTGAAKFLKLEETKYFQIGTNKADESDKNLYLVPQYEETENTFRVAKAGDYYYILMRNILRMIGIDYINENAIFDIFEIENADKKMYKLTRRK